MILRDVLLFRRSVFTIAGVDLLTATITTDPTFSKGPSALLLDTTLYSNSIFSLRSGKWLLSKAKVVMLGPKTVALETYGGDATVGNPT